MSGLEEKLRVEIELLRGFKSEIETKVNDLKRDYSVIQKEHEELQVRVQTLEDNLSGVCEAIFHEEIEDDSSPEGCYDWDPAIIQKKKKIKKQ